MEENNKIENFGLMYIRCAWCCKWMDVKSGLLWEITHSICPECLKKETEQFNLSGSIN